MKVVEFKPRESVEPHAAGECICANCRHEWIGAATVGATQLECPECGTHRGAFKYPFGPQVDEDGYQCNCGSETFFIMRRQGQASGAVYCRGCGLEAAGWFK